MHKTKETLRISKPRSKIGFLKNYKLGRTYILKPDRKAGTPGIYEGFSPNGGQVIVKVWPRINSTNDLELKDIWRNELRQLHRLAGYPGAMSCIAHLVDAGYDDAGFYLVISSGQRRPLQAFIDKVDAGHWLKQPAAATNRAKIWANLKSLANGLDILHSQGLLHRNIDSWSVLTNGSENPDFMLTGFEWSMRIMGSAPPERSFEQAYLGRTQDSFLHDWRKYGLLAASLLGVEVSRLQDLGIPSHEVANHLIADEAQLLRNLIQCLPIFPINSEVIASRIDNILRILESKISDIEPKLHIAFYLGVDSPLSNSIRSASDNEIEVDNIQDQINFIKEDLIYEPLLVAIKPFDGGGMQIVLRGKYLLYQIQEYRYQNAGSPTWEFAYCESSQKNQPAPPNILGQRLIQSSSLEIMTTGEAHRQFPRLRGKLISWEYWRTRLITEKSVSQPEYLTHKALTLIQFLEALYAATDIFPVDVIDASYVDAKTSSGDVALKVCSRKDVGKDRLSRALKVKSPAKRLVSLLTGDGVRPDGWILTDSKSLSESNPTNTEWKFKDVEKSSGNPESFIFNGDTIPNLAREAFLIPSESIGQNRQFRRRLKALNALKEHEELLRMIVDRRGRILSSHESVTEDDAFNSLDKPKQEALRELVSTLPLYLIQGPPGVGKTRLIRDLVRRLFADEPTSRLLLTAQSNAAIDHLMLELEAILDMNADSCPLVVRCIPRDRQETPSRFDIRIQANQLINRLAVSELVSELPVDELPVDFREKISNFLRDSSTADKKTLRAVEGVVVRAANIVFSTTNSGELERLIEERGQFDWSIVEEAGKATGAELVSPMLLSHRRLMIGDHKQLPPFLSDQMVSLLESPESVAESIKIGEEFIGRALRDATTEEILDQFEDDNSSLPELCAKALEVITLFETAIESEFRNQERKPSSRPIAKRLTLQHRMHPYIASLVSRCFYGGKLVSHPDCVLRYERTEPPYISSDKARLPLAPIVVIDMPYVQSKIGHKSADSYPRWHNPMEVRAVMELLGLLVPKSIKEITPSLAVLSPYKQQVDRLEETFKDLRSKKMPNLDGFKSSSKDGTFFHTVDSFQGSESDIVIVSLVRNNAHSNIQNALGFLSDIRRMNVLLSRAKWQLVLVASIDFLSEVVKAGNNAEQINFIREMLDELSCGEKIGSVAKVPFERLMGSN